MVLKRVLQKKKSELTIDEIIEIALGELRISYTDFLKMDFKILVLAISGFRNAEEKKHNFKLQVMRKIMWASMMPHMKRGFKETEIQQFDFEKEAVDLLEITDYESFLEEIEEVKKFYESQDRNVHNS